MGLNLVTDEVIIVENDPARVIGKHGKANIAFSTRRAHLFGGSCDEGFEQAALSAFQIGVEKAMLAVFGPRLRQRFDLDVRWLTAQGGKVVADHA